MTRLAANSAISSSASAGGYRRPETPNPNWRVTPTHILPAYADLVSSAEIEGRLGADFYMLESNGRHFPYSEVA